ncbi:MAG: hypothetical protein FWF94_01950 [Oscillospiraceae bacterium]|nr:hypothetical protein [Oscillospiraceae bacterium]
MNNNDLALCPRCSTAVNIYTPDCPTCGYFIWGDDEEDLEADPSGASGISSGFKEDFADEDAFEDYCDYNDADFVDFDFADWDDDLLEEDW